MSIFDYVDNFVLKLQPSYCDPQGLRDKIVRLHRLASRDHLERASRNGHALIEFGDLTAEEKETPAGNSQVAYAYLITAAVPAGALFEVFTEMIAVAEIIDAPVKASILHVPVTVTATDNPWQVLADHKDGQKGCDFWSCAKGRFVSATCLIP